MQRNIYSFLLGSSNCISRPCCQPDVLGQAPHRLLCHGWCSWMLHLVVLEGQICAFPACQAVFLSHRALIGATLGRVMVLRSPCRRPRGEQSTALAQSAAAGRGKNPPKAQSDGDNGDFCTGRARASLPRHDGTMQAVAAHPLWDRQTGWEH